MTLLEADTGAIARARARWDALAKPPGSLGRLEDIAAWVAGARGEARAERARVLVFAADHGVARSRPVSAYPPEVTAAMVRTFAAGRACVSALARAAQAELEVVDVGVRGLKDTAATQGCRLVRSPVAAGCGDIAREPAMSESELETSLQVGFEAAERAAADGVELLALGEMGIGNTTPASALTAYLLDRAAETVVGPGTGLDAAGVSVKARVVAEAARRCPAGLDARGALRQLGGFELAALAGAMIGAAERRIAVILDGFIVGAAALCAQRMRPGLAGFLLPATRSAEPGHEALLAALKCPIAPLFDFGLRLGEASGAALAIPIVRAACRVLSEAATLAEVIGTDS